MQRLDQRRYAKRMVVKLSKHNRNAEEKVYCEERESKETVPSSLPLDAGRCVCLKIWIFPLSTTVVTTMLRNRKISGCLMAVTLTN